MERLSVCVLVAAPSGFDFHGRPAVAESSIGIQNIRHCQAIAGRSAMVILSRGIGSIGSPHAQRKKKDTKVKKLILTQRPQERQAKKRHGLRPCEAGNAYEKTTSRRSAFPWPPMRSVM
jgi:hypothetical protein